METTLPEVHPSGYPHPDFPGPTDTKRFREDDMGKDKGSLGVPTPVNYPLPFRMDVKQHPTATVGVAYQLSDCAAILRQQLCHKASSVTPPFRCDLLL